MVDRKKCCKSGAEGILSQPIMCLTPLIASVIFGVFEPECIVQMRPTMHFLVRQLMNVVCLLGAIALLTMGKPPLSCLFVAALLVSAEVSSIASPYCDGFDAGGTVIAYLRHFLLVALFVYWMIKCPKRLLFLLSFYFWAICIVNLISEVAFPSGLYQTAWTHEPCFLLGHKNSILLSLLPGLISVGLYEVYEIGSGGWGTYLYLLATLCNVVVAGSSTSSAATAITILLAFLLLSNSTIKPGIVLICSAGAITSVLIIFFKVQDGLKSLLFTLFHKGVTFSNRSIIWDKYVALLDGNVMLGVGALQSEKARSLTQAVNAHNMLLDILATGGLVRLAIYIAAIGVVYGAARKSVTDRGVGVFLLAIVCLAIIGLMETFDAAWTLYFICALFEGYYVTKLAGGQTALAGKARFRSGRGAA